MQSRLVGLFMSSAKLDSAIQHGGKREQPERRSVLMDTDLQESQTF